MLIDSSQAGSDRLRELKTGGYNAAVLMLTDGSDRDTVAAAQRILSAGLDLYYWIEIARNPALADAHPEWMASLQGHPEWRRFFPSLPPARTNAFMRPHLDRVA